MNEPFVNYAKPVFPGRAEDFLTAGLSKKPVGY